MTSVSTAQRAPARLFDVRVARVERLSASFVRVWFRGAGLEGLWSPPEGLRDLRVKIIVPAANDAPVPNLDPASPGWYAEWLRLDESLRGHLRTYTLRAVRGHGADTEIAIDFVLHVPSGPASRWAARASVGDQLLVIGPVAAPDHPGPQDVRYRGIEWNPTARDCVLVADETALPAVSSILSGLDERFRVQAFIEVADPGDLHDITSAADLTCHWFIRNSCGAEPGRLVTAALRKRLGVAAGSHDAGHEQESAASDVVWETEKFSAAGEDLCTAGSSAAQRYFWVAGEAGMVAELRRVLVHQLQVPRHSAAFMGYWRAGRSST